jgi:ring-1,2-phenylacetyl-CoA epoxidase subunit PaaB
VGEVSKSYKFLSQSNSTLKSLDPRVNRLPAVEGESLEKEPLDQLVTFEVFVQPKEGKPFQHEGAVHAPELELAFVLAKETFTRRFTCTSLWVVETSNIFVSPTTEASVSIYASVPPVDLDAGDQHTFEIFHLPKRGKQHLHFQTVNASSPEQAIAKAKQLVPPTVIVYNVWAIPAEAFRKATAEEKELWATLPDKKFRDAGAYKGGEKLKDFLERNNV